ncbi:putative gustatory receptor 28b [Anopheles darlingi]|uniref:putative gustatory receptor 28b n=1 Tax=Anopheles darlingi TaxID=43151 RepID=UPI0021002822|nr:putative gustatory receptor 28b [Anopheles darlingi]
MTNRKFKSSDLALPLAYKASCRIVENHNIMSKWINKQKVFAFPLSPLKLPSVKSGTGGDSDTSFEELFHFAFKCFRCLGLTPGEMRREKGRFIVQNTRWMMLIVAMMVLVTWATLIESFFIETRSALITGIANHIQFLMNTIALTTAWIMPQMQPRELEAILDGFLIIDRELCTYNASLVQPPVKTKFIMHYLFVVCALVILVAYDGFVTFSDIQTGRVWYWVFHQIPFIIYAMAMLAAFVLVYWLLARFKHLNKLVEQYYREGQLCDAKPAMSITFSETVQIEDNTKDAISLGEREYFSEVQILAIVSRAIDLAQKIESYFGPLFLTVYTALFTVTTIQSYYCYLHMTVQKYSKGLTIESLFLSLSIIVSNVITIVALPYICEKVENESKLLMSYLSKLSMKNGQIAQQSFIWFPNLISSVRFSALGFFNVNYSMLSGFIAGMITYLIIFIQFNSMVPGDVDDVHYARRHTLQEVPTNVVSAGSTRMMVP